MFFKKYKFPLNLFLTFEHLNPIVYTSETLSANHYVCLINNVWYYPINLILRKDNIFSFNALIEMSAIDTYDYSEIFPEYNNILTSSRLLLHNTYYMYNNKLRLTLFQPYSFEHTTRLYSLDTSYKNANWMERELSEMFSPIFLNKSDVRMLLLDYPKDNNPLLKDFPVESWGELYYDFLDKSLYYTDVIDHTEL